MSMTARGRLPLPNKRFRLGADKVGNNQPFRWIRFCRPWLLSALVAGASPLMACAPERLDDTPTPAQGRADPSPMSDPNSVAFAGAVLPQPPGGYQWVKNAALSDEFNGDSLDTSKWMARHPYWNGGRGVGQFSPANVKEGGGALHLFGSLTGPYMGKQRWVGTACVSSLQPIAFYGYYEARMKASQLGGTTSSFWFQTKHNEIDVVEAFGAPRTHPGRIYEMQSTLHDFPIDPAKPGDRPSTHWTHMTVPVTEWHTYGVWWRDANTVIFYLDGREVNRQTPASPFVTPLYMFLDTEVFKEEGLPTPQELQDPSRNTMDVDWMRAYTLRPVS